MGNAESKSFSAGVPKPVGRLDGLRMSTDGNSFEALIKRTGLGLSSEWLSSDSLQSTGLKSLETISYRGSDQSLLSSETPPLKGLQLLGAYFDPNEVSPKTAPLSDLDVVDMESKGDTAPKSLTRSNSDLSGWSNADKPFLYSTGFANVIRTAHYHESKGKAEKGLKVEKADMIMETKRVDHYLKAKETGEAEKAEYNKTDSNTNPVTGDYEDVMSVDFSSQDFLGQGKFGTVYKVQLRKGTVAVKVLKTKARPGTAEYEGLTKEAKMMRDFTHENIIGMYAYGCRDQEVIYVMEYANGKSLWDAMKNCGALPFEKCIRYSIHINAGLKYLHSRTPPLEHCNLKPENILICNTVAKICNFAISSTREAKPLLTDLEGGFHFKAPEHSNSAQAHGPLSDMYSFGLVVWAMIEGKRPYDGLDDGQIIALKERQIMPEISSTMPTKLAKIMDKCWSYAPHHRPSAALLESELIDIQRNPKVMAPSEYVRYMNSKELARYLCGKNALPTFVVAIEENDITGARFLALDAKDLMADPFRLSAFQARVIARLIQEANLA